MIDSMRRMSGQEQAEAAAEAAASAAATGTPAPASGSALKPFIDKVGVPLLWFGIGYLAATLIQRPRRVA